MLAKNCWHQTYVNILYKLPYYLHIFCRLDRRQQVRGRKDNMQCSEAGSKWVENNFMALYLHSLSLCSDCGCSCSSSVKRLLSLALSQAHCAALSLDWVSPRQPDTLRLSMEDKLQHNGEGQNRDPYNRGIRLCLVCVCSGWLLFPLWLLYIYIYIHKGNNNQPDFKYLTCCI